MRLGRCHVYPAGFVFVFLLVCRGAGGLLCYNGTLTSLRYGVDPLVGNGPFSPKGKSVARLRCSMTVNCEVAAGLSCFNCSSTQLDWSFCAGDFTTVPQQFNSTKLRLVNCSGGLTACADNAMCFVRSWAARAKHAWLVQRGCYQAGREDPLPQSLHIPMRSMSCKHERLGDAEYKVCLCQADWCNSAKSNVYHETQLKFTRSIVALLVCYIPYLYML